MSKKINLQDEVYDGEVIGGWMRGGLGQLVDERLGRWNLKNGGLEWVGWKKGVYIEDEVQNDEREIEGNMDGDDGFGKLYDDEADLKDDFKNVLTSRQSRFKGHRKGESFDLLRDSHKSQRSHKNKRRFYYQRSMHKHLHDHKDVKGDGAVMITFKFDGTRNFSDVRLHVNNDPGKHIGMFSRCRVEFSFDASNWLARHDVVFSNSQSGKAERARWVRVDLKGEIGRYVRVSLRFGDQWLMLSEVHFSSCEFIYFFSLF